MVTPLFLPAIPGSRFAVHHPANGVCTGLVLYLHPFAEEMNKSRRMAAMQAKALASAGLEVLQIDLLGCGDSSGETQDATWMAWQQDVVTSVQWLRKRHSAQPKLPLWLWGLRSGALLAACTARTHAYAIGPCNFLFWQPAVQGRNLLQQFLRLRVAGQLARGIGKTVAEGLDDAASPTRGLNTDQLRQQLQQGHTLDIAGYQLSPGLALGLDAATLSPPPNSVAQCSPKLVVWLEVSSREVPTLLPVSETAVSRWQQIGFEVQAQAVRGPAFWQSTEIEDAPELLEATTNLLSGTLEGATPEVM